MAWESFPVVEFDLDPGLKINGVFTLNDPYFSFIIGTLASEFKNRQWPWARDCKPLVDTINLKETVLYSLNTILLMLLTPQSIILTPGLPDHGLINSDPNIWGYNE